MKGRGEMDNQKGTEIAGGIIGAICSAFIDSWQIIVVALILYAITLAGNLLSGIFLSKQQNNYSEDIATKAVYRKLGMLTGIVCMIFVDWIVMGIARSGNINYSIPFFTCILVGYASTHEFASMIGNIKLLGNSVPIAIEGAINKAEKAFDMGKIPSMDDIMNNDSGGDKK